MKYLTWVLLVVFLASSAAVILAGNTQMTKDKITIDTPKKKSKGNPTHVIFDHKKHATEYASGCDKCHPALKQTLNAPENDKNTVHNTCKECHNKDKPAKTFKCSSCHQPVS